MYKRQVEQRVAVVPEFKPELASMNCGSINWGLFPILDKIKEFKYPWEEAMLNLTKNYIFDNTFEAMEKMCKIFEEHGTKPELEIYDTGHLYNVAYLLDKGIVKPPITMQFVTGILGGINSVSYTHLDVYKRQIYGVAIALTVGVVLTYILNWKRFQNPLKALNDGCGNSIMALINTSAVVGFGFVVQNVPAFQSFVKFALGLKFHPLVSEAIAVNIIAGITGSASGGLTIFMKSMGEAFLATGVSPEALHRVASIASGLSLIHI